MKISAPLLFLLLYLAASVKIEAQEQTQVFTLYFSGTSMNREMWQDSASAFGRRESIATLHRYQVTDAASQNQHKGIVDGFSGLDVARPGWDKKYAEALALIEPLFEQIECTKCIILNLVGFSRGAVSTMHFAHHLDAAHEKKHLESKIRRINILAFDPVPGDPTLSDANFNLPPSVANYIGFYSEDERTPFFSPVFPASLATTTRTQLRFFLVPGSHETMVGSHKIDGHSHNPASSLEDAESLGHLSHALRIAAAAIMSSSEWGRVRFDAEFAPDLNNILTVKEQLENEIDDAFSDANIELYMDMRNKSFPEALGVTTAWAQGLSKCIPTIIASKENSRCAYGGPFPGKPLGIANRSVNSVDDSLPLDSKDVDGEYILWNLIKSYH